MQAQRDEILSPEAAQTLILEHIHPLGVERVGLLQAHSRILAEDVAASSDIPSSDNSAMDGYALKAEDTVGASKEKPVFLKRVAEVRAGDDASSIEVKRGEAVKIMTGGMIPHLATLWWR